MPPKLKAQYQNGRLIPVMDTELTNFSNEKWKDLPHFDGYMISNYGRAKSLSSYRYDALGREYFKKEQILKLTIRNRGTRNGIELHINVNNVQSTFSISRLVYTLFVEDFDQSNLKCVVARKDGNNLNCYFKNLKLVSVGENIKDDYVRGRKCGFAKKVIHQYDTEGRFVQTFDSVMDASKYFRVGHSSIYSAAKLLRYRCKQFYWRFGEAKAQIDVAAFNHQRENQKRLRKRPILKKSKNGKFLTTFESIAFAAKELKIDENRIRRACRNATPIKDYFLSYIEQ